MILYHNTIRVVCWNCLLEAYFAITYIPNIPEYVSVIGIRLVLKWVVIIFSAFIFFPLFYKLLLKNIIIFSSLIKKNDFYFFHLFKTSGDPVPMSINMRFLWWHFKKMSFNIWLQNTPSPTLNFHIDLNIPYFSMSFFLTISLLSPLQWFSASFFYT